MATTSKWVIPAPRKTLVAGVGDMVVSNDPGAELVTYSLGSCLGITVYDATTRVGGLLHIMLPDSKIDPAKATTSPYMFVDTGVPRLFLGVYNLGAARERLIVKVAGGAQLLDPQNVFNIGERNFKALTELLVRNGYALHSWDVGGLSSRTLRMDMTTGKITVKSPGLDIYDL